MSRHNLPTFPTPFIGRSDEITELSQLLDNPDCRLLTLVGPGGIGKTRLAVEVACCLQGEFSDGIYFVPLQPLQSTDQVLSAIIDVLPLQISGDDPESQMLDYLHEKNLLLILDNFEHVLLAVDLVDALLTKTSRVKLVVTSREILRLQGEWVRGVDGLRYPHNGFEDNEVDQSALELFAERARRLNSDFSLEQDHNHVLRICQLVGGMPLALELAAGWMDTLTCCEVADEIARDLSILTTDARNVPDRHRNIEAVLDHSWQRLSVEERAVFRKLCIFRGGFEREAAEPVAGATHPILSELVRKSWLRKHAGRYDIQEVLRQYGADQLSAAGETQPVQTDHANYYASFMQQREADLKGRRQLEGLDEIQTDFPNIRMAWYWAMEHRKYSILNCMIDAHYWYCFMRGRSADWAVIADSGDQLAPIVEHSFPTLWAKIVSRCGFTIQPAIDMVYRAYEVALAAGDLVTAVAALQGSAWQIYVQRGDYSEAIRRYQQCLTFYQQLGDTFGEADVYHCLHQCYEAKGEWDIAHRNSQLALALCLENGDKIRSAKILDTLSVSTLYKGEYEVARRYNSEAQTISRELKDASRELSCDWEIAFDNWLSGNFDQAQIYATLPDNVNDLMRWSDYGVSLIVRGLVFCMEASYVEAQQLCGQDYQQDSNVASLRYRYDLCFAIAACGLEDEQGAITYITGMLKFGLKAGTLGLLTWCLPVAAVLLAHRDQLEFAAELLGLAFTHPKSATGWMEKWPLLTRLRAQLEAELGTDAYMDAWERGAKRDLITVADKLLSELDSDHHSARERANQALDEPLTKRELNDVLPLMARGHSDRQIAGELVIALGTTKRYTYNIRQKLGAENRTHAVARARELGLL